MKKMSNVFLYIILFALLYNCDNNIDDEVNTQTAIVLVKHHYSGRRAPTWNVINIPNIYVSAHLSGNPLPEVNDIRIADQHYSNPNHFIYNQGDIYYSTETNIWEDNVQEPKFNPLTIIINTNIGTIEGSITVPDTIHTITIDAPDTIVLNTPLSISWSGSNADYYHVQYYHNWMEEEFYWLGYSKDTIVQGINLVFDGSQFSKDGDISEIEITPINGPFPTKNAKANLTGQGFGFLYLQNSAIRSDRTIVIGKGIDYSLWEQSGTKNTSVKADSKKIYDKIESVLH